MDQFALSGSDTAIINDRVLSDFADGDCVMVEPQGEIAKVKKGKNGNAIFALDESGTMAKTTYRIVRGSPDDKFLLDLLTQQQANFAGFPLMSGEFVKKIGDGKGNIAGDTYISSGGIFLKLVPAKSNVEGDTAQSLAIYEVMYAKLVRVIT